MKKLLYGSLYLLCFLSVSFFSCKKNPDTNNSSTTPGNAFPIPSTTPVNGTVSGRVVDEGNDPVFGADIKCGGLSAVTDADGFFNIKNVSLDKYISTVTVSKTGYFKGYRSFSANATRNFVHIKLVPRTLSGTFSTTVGGSISLSNGTNINFQPNSIVLQAGGAPYNGTVNVFASYIDPTKTDINSTVPGSFMGRDNSNLYSLQSAGMIAVDIEAVTGELLQLAPGSPATIKLPIPSSLISKAPNNIDTWSLDDQGIWKKEGTAVKSNDHYEFSATHFSFWNCDIPNNAVYLSLHLQDNNGNKLVNTTVNLSITNNNFWNSTTYGVTDELGNVSGMVPAGYDIVLQIFPSINVSICNSSLYSQDLGPFTTNTSLTINASLTQQQVQQNIITVSGVANDCNGQPLQIGTALISNGQYFSYATVTNGSYSTLLTHCDAIPSVTVLVTDDNTTAVSIPVVAPINGNTLTIPTITLGCGFVLNALDGIYLVTGTYVDATNTNATLDYPKQYQLITNGPSSVLVAQSLNGEIVPAIIFSVNGSPAFFGNFGLQASFDLTSNLVTEMHNYYGDPANPLTFVGDPAVGSGAPNYMSGGTGSIRSATLDPSGLNNYDPVGRVIRVKYFMYQSTFTTGPRCSFDETWTYIGPR